ncbi:hypothetical protein FKP32DRAFT_290023 [Trametes sanguinea]|nr:hypothetical protein FKP32DRAFT_290023 [Trametes sanguinea]
MRLGMKLCAATYLSWLEVSVMKSAHTNLLHPGVRHLKKISCLKQTTVTSCTAVMTVTHIWRVYERPASLHVNRHAFRAVMETSKHSKSVKRRPIYL